MIRRRPRAARRQPSEIAEGLSGVMLCGLRRALRQEPIVKSAKARLTALGLIEKQPDRFSKLTDLGVRVLQAAQVVETSRKGRT